MVEKKNHLAGFAAAKARAQEGRKVIVMNINGVRHYYGGANGFGEDRANASTYVTPPQEVLRQYPEARAVLV